MNIFNRNPYSRPHRARRFFLKLKEYFISKVTGGIYVPHLKNHVITPALNYLGLGGEQAVNLVTGTFLAEEYSGGSTYLKLLGKGPAVGAAQMEPATYRDIWKKFLSNPKCAMIAARLRNMDRTFIADNNGIPKPDAMIGD